MTDNKTLCQSFRFTTIRFLRSHFTDMRRGAPCNYLALMKKGTAQFVFASERVEISAGDLFFVPKGLVYKSFWQGDPEIEWDTYGFSAFPDSSDKVYTMQKITYSEKEAELLRDLALHHAVDSLSVGRLYTLLGLILPKMTCSAAPRNGEVINKAIAVMTEFPDLTVPDVAERCNVSVSGLYAMFRRELGMTPVDERHIILCKKAEKLLTDTDTDIETVSEICGFSSSSYFRKVLFKVTGKTPTEIRKSAPLI